MPLALDAYAEIAPPMLTCVQKNDGYQFELMISVGRDEKEITKVRIGPYQFRKQYRPSSILGGLISKGGPESTFFMHKSAPAGWSRPRWETASDAPDAPFYLTWNGHLAPGSIGVFRFISGFRPGGLRKEVVLYRGTDEQHIGVNGPNYERFEDLHHGD